MRPVGQSRLDRHEATAWQKPKVLQKRPLPQSASLPHTQRPVAVSQVSPAGQVASLPQAQVPSGRLVKPAGQQPTPVHTQARTWAE